VIIRPQYKQKTKKFGKWLAIREWFARVKAVFQVLIDRKIQNE
jgi:vancomycin permeability regulator SanA